MRKVNRRLFLLGGAATAAAVGTLGASGLRAVAAPPFPYPFRLGVASGDPTPGGVVLWTRLAPSPLNSDGLGGMGSANVDVEWQLSTTDTFTTLVRSGVFTATQAAAHSVHIELDGLTPGAQYFYRFRAGGYISPVGRTRTAPDPGAAVSSLTILTASCASYPAGYYTAYRRMAEENAGLILHLGDYIYESGSADVRAHSPASEIMSLANYRVRHAQYKTDLDLQAAHASAPWMVVWDDHEVENNYAGLIQQDPADGVNFRARRANAYKAYWENMPLRASSLPVAENMQLYRRFSWGNLATFHMLDTRQYRSDQCAAGNTTCVNSATRSITGATQEAWLLDGMAASPATWEIIGQQVFFAARNTSTDSWDGYKASRSRIQQAWVDRGIANPVVLTGDVHAAWASDLKLNYSSTTSPRVGVEFVTTSIGSGGDGSEGGGVNPDSANPHIKFHNSRRGYTRITLTPAQVRADFRRLAYIRTPGAPVSTVASYVSAAGSPGLVKV
ncbi:MAG TPA: alkaline phosphatase D family protein [Candidatus Limnocylindrales bacterium]